MTLRQIFKILLTTTLVTLAGLLIAFSSSCYKPAPAPTPTPQPTTPVTETKKPTSPQEETAKKEATPTAPPSPTPLPTPGPATTPTPSPTPTPTPTPTPSTNEVKISDFAFAPATMTVTIGAFVTWTNLDLVSHTVTSDSGPFASGTLSRNATFSYTFTERGTFSYHCAIHPYMEAKVIVE